MVSSSSSIKPGTTSVGNWLQILRVGGVGAFVTTLEEKKKDSDNMEGYQLVEELQEIEMQDEL